MIECPGIGIETANRERATTRLKSLGQFSTDVGAYVFHKDEKMHFPRRSLIILFMHSHMRNFPGLANAILFIAIAIVLWPANVSSVSQLHRPTVDTARVRVCVCVWELSLKLFLSFHIIMQHWLSMWPRSSHFLWPAVGYVCKK